MNNISPPLTFSVPLGSSAHAIAQQFWRKQTLPQKAKQVYLNTLAVSAVQFYLRCMGIETDTHASLSWNPVMQTLMDVADLKVTGLGLLECRPVLPDNPVVYIPPEVWSDRIGYIAVQFDESLRQATLLGFINTALNNALVPISHLRSLEDLLEHLCQLRQPEQVLGSVNLSQWFENLFDAGWQSLETLLGTEQDLAFSFRMNASLSENGIKGAKLIDLGLQLGHESVAMLLAVTPDDEQKVAILVQVHPTGGANYLPPNLRLSLISESGANLQEVQSRTQDNYIQMKRFRGNPGERFSIKVALEDASVTEHFVI